MPTARPTLLLACRATRGEPPVLAELAVSDLGVIDGVALVLDPGMTALTGETGAGKTMLVGAIGLLAGDRADPSMVRPGADGGHRPGPLRGRTTTRWCSPGSCRARAGPARTATAG